MTSESMKGKPRPSLPENQSLPQRQRGFSPFHQQMAMRKPVSTPRVVSKDTGCLGIIVKAAPTSRRSQIIITVHPSQAQGKPQPQPYRLAGNQIFLLGSVISVLAADFFVLQGTRSEAPYGHGTARKKMPHGAVRSRSRSQYRLGWRPPRRPLTSSEGLSLFRPVQPPV